ncbi:polyphosphate:AMP phosphotransferase [Silvimonas amylolytica]|uniref:Polyphosphate:AMP phosphotransferase n=1 Tax=Silvimonas amylolytica TaxID=449663 RepID=A0ABQ2PP52_9NEIS|nr:polyphosphate:AMP phosphotransferase [Silvimonas amylolytica]GGP26797.1 polyphosphate:AMP phosphotransferase [Silvimonas amylolytica]
MFEAAELGHHIDKATYKAEEPGLREALLDLQYQLHERAERSVVILLSGVPTAGKGEMANKLMEWLDPRHIATHAFGTHSQDDAGRPEMYRFWRSLPPKGQISILFGGWYAGPIWEGEQQQDFAAWQREAEKIARFERMLASEGVLLLKFWLHLSADELKKRMKALSDNPLTAWRIADEDHVYLKHYQRNLEGARKLLMATNLADAPWRVVECVDENFRALTVGRQLKDALAHHVAQSGQTENRVDAPPLLAPVDGLRLLDTLKLDQDLDKKDYQRELELLQGRLNGLSRDPGFRNMAVVVAFEGMDAAGKGGSIRRITGALDVRSYQVVPIAAPTDEEKAQPWLWRFWRHVPARGRFTVFDRTWYGRVLVERIEGFARVPEWMRAYNEINDFEMQLDAANVIVVKFWLAIDDEEQLKRFKAREEIGYKRFKITDDDWRNREKWSQYIEAASDMIERTSTPYAPWHLIGANNKYHARIKVLQTLCETIEARLARRQTADKAAHKKK